jgi:hypothetical protein
LHDFFNDEAMEIVQLLIKAGATITFKPEDIPEEDHTQKALSGPRGRFGRNTEESILYVLVVLSYTSGSKYHRFRNALEQPLLKLMTGVESTFVPSIRAVKLLLESGADVNSFRSSYDTALDIIEKLSKSLSEEDEEVSPTLVQRYEEVLQTLNPNSYEYNEVKLALEDQRYKDKKPQPYNPWNQVPDKDKKAEYLKFVREGLKELKDILLKHGAKVFLDLELNAEDKEAVANQE